MIEAKNIPDKEILAGLLSPNSNESIFHIYDQYSETVCAYVISNGGSLQDGEDIFQETVVSFIEVVRNRKYRNEASIKTFLVSIARNNWLNEIKKRKSLDHRAKVFESNRPQSEVDITVKFSQEEASRQFLEVMNRLGSSCKAVLTSYYYDNLSFKEIAAKLDYENEQVARNKKYKCMKELTEIIRDNPILKELAHIL